MIEDQPLRATLVGAGAMGWVWANCLTSHPKTSLVGLIDENLRAARGIALRLRRSDLPISRNFQDLSAEADFCVVATPPTSHFHVVQEALERGLHVICEKPFTISLAEAITLTNLAKSRGLVLMVSQNRTLESGLLELRNRAQELQPMAYLTVEFSRRHEPSGFRATIEHPLLLDMAIHAFDAARFVVGATPISVYCHEFNPPWSQFRENAAAVAIFEMSNGLTFTYCGSWCGGGVETSWSGNWTIAGEHGQTTWTGSGSADLTKVFDQVRAPLDDFLACLIESRTVWGSASNNLFTVAMVEGAIHSSVQERKINIAQLFDSAGLSGF